MLTVEGNPALASPSHSCVKERNCWKQTRFYPESWELKKAVRVIVCKYAEAPGLDTRAGPEVSDMRPRALAHSAVREVLIRLHVPLPGVHQGRDL